MIRKIIHIDTDACTGCGLCAEACHEGAIQMTDGKAVLTREDYCDGLGDCLPACPAGAISFTGRTGRPGKQLRLSLCCLPLLIRQRRSESIRNKRSPGLPVPMACSDQTGACTRSLF